MSPNWAVPIHLLERAIDDVTISYSREGLAE